FTYGDTPYVNARASSLRGAQPGDLLFFLANLANYDWDTRQFTPGQRGLYLIGFIEISAVIEYLPSTGQLRDCCSEECCAMDLFTRNAHVNHLLTLPHKYMHQRFSVFEGGKRSRRFRYAVPITKEMCDACLRDKESQCFDYGKFKSFSACIGSYTRSVRSQFNLQYLADRERFQIFKEYIARLNDMPEF
ncbi:MAG: hypothetical protein JOZ18_13070, partial [Chloroflexi bacterium]|nr:hypothetical protein [Chloroflexota bacterium]